MAYGAPARSGGPRPRTWPTGTTPPPPRKGHFSGDILTDGFGRPGGPPQAPKPVYELSRCVDPTENARFSVSAGLGSPEDLSGTREWPVSASRQAILRSPRREDPRPCRGAFAERNGPSRRSSDACIELCRDRPERRQPRQRLQVAGGFIPACAGNSSSVFQTRDELSCSMSRDISGIARKNLACVFCTARMFGLRLRLGPLGGGPVGSDPVFRPWPGPAVARGGRREARRWRARQACG